jgi:D-alanyl-D-alanine carboxypeptidase
MMSKKCVTALGIILCVGMLLVSAAAGFSKSSITPVSPRNHLTAEVSRVPRKLVLRSDAVLVEDQQTGAFLIQKKAQDVLPIASITKLINRLIIILT